MSEGSIYKVPSLHLFYSSYTVQWSEKDVGMDEALHTTFTFLTSLHTFWYAIPTFSGRHTVLILIFLVLVSIQVNPEYETG